MVVGYIDKQAPVNYVDVVCELGHKVNSTSSSFYLRRPAGDNTSIHNFKCFYRDIKAIGQHFVVYQDDYTNMIGKPLKR